jgi:hypothetical protein
LVTISLPLVEGDKTSTINEGIPSYLFLSLTLSWSQMTTISGCTTFGFSSNLVVKPKSFISSGAVKD